MMTLRTGPFTHLLLAANQEKKISKDRIQASNIQSEVRIILDQTQPRFALCFRSQLLVGIVKIYKRQLDYLCNDCHEIIAKINMTYAKFSGKKLFVQESKSFNCMEFEEEIDLASYHPILDLEPGATQILESLNFIHYDDSEQSMFQIDRLENDRSNVVNFFWKGKDSRHEVSLKAIENVDMNLDLGLALEIDEDIDLDLDIGESLLPLGHIDTFDSLLNHSDLTSGGDQSNYYDVVSGDGNDSDSEIWFDYNNNNYDDGSSNNRNRSKTNNKSKNHEHLNRRTQIPIEEIRANLQDRRKILRPDQSYSYSSTLLALNEKNHKDPRLHYVHGHKQFLDFAPELRGILASLHVVLPVNSKRTRTTCSPSNERKKRRRTIHHPNDDSNDVCTDNGSSVTGFHQYTNDRDNDDDDDEGLFVSTTSGLANFDYADSYFSSLFQQRVDSDLAGTPQEAKINFHELLPENQTTRTDATRLFVEILALATKDVLAIEQIPNHLNSPLLVQVKPGLLNAAVEEI